MMCMTVSSEDTKSIYAKIHHSPKITSKNRKYCDACFWNTFISRKFTTGPSLVKCYTEDLLFPFHTWGEFLLPRNFYFIWVKAKHASMRLTHHKLQIQLGKQIKFKDTYKSSFISKSVPRGKKNPRSMRKAELGKNTEFPSIKQMEFHRFMLTWAVGLVKSHTSGSKAVSFRRNQLHSGRLGLPLLIRATSLKIKSYRFLCTVVSCYIF